MRLTSGTSAASGKMRNIETATLRGIADKVASKRCPSSLKRSAPDSQGESKSGLAAAPAAAVFERQHSAVFFGDLAAERESDARPAGFGGEERDEEVRS